MLKPSDIEHILEEMMTSLPEGLKTLPGDLRHNVKGALQGVLSRLDLITRESFDAQVGVLQRSRAKLDAMERILAETQNTSQSE